MSNTYCPLPWIHLGTHPHGGVTPCCISDHTAGKNRARNFGSDGDKFFNLNEHRIDAHLNSDYFKLIRRQMLNDQKPAACMRCYDEETKGLRSKRQHELSQYPHRDYSWARTSTDPTGGIDLDLRFVELRLGNVCNVRCRTCNPASSSQWRKDYETIVEKLEFVNDGYSWLDHKRDFKWPEDEQFYEDLYNCAPRMEVLYINGGEPTLIKAHWRYLRRLVESGRSKNIVLWYNINMTNLPNEAIGLWREFKEARICPSIDDLDLRNHYIRYPSTWNDVKKNLTAIQVPGLNVRITQTVSAYNFAYLDQFLTWAPVPVDMNFVYDPDFLSPSVLPPAIRKEIIDGLRAGPHGNSEHVGTLHSMYYNDEWDAVKWEQFCKFNDQLDSQRPPLTWRKVFPELVEMLEKQGIKYEY
jgi:hypothetical protein